MTVVAMSHGELSRFDTLSRVDRDELRVEDAATLLGLKRRQIFRLLERLRTEGASGLVSRKRGRPSNRRYSDVFREQILSCEFQLKPARDSDAKPASVPTGNRPPYRREVGHRVWRKRAAERVSN